MTLTSPTSFNLFWTCASSSQLLWFLLASSQLISFILTSCQLFSALLPFFSALPSPAFFNSAQLIPASSQLFSTSSFFPPFSTLFSPSPCHFVLILHREAFTHGCLCTQILLHTETFTQKSFYTQKLLHRKAFTHKSLYREAFTQRSFYTEKFLHIEAFTQSLCAEKHLHKEAFTKKFLHRKASTQRSFYTKDKPFAQRSLHVQNGSRNCSSKKGSQHQREKNERYFTRILFKESPAPKYAKMEKNLRNHHHRPWCGHFNTIHDSQLQKTIILHTAAAETEWQKLRAPQQKLKLQNWISKKRMRHFLQGCLKGKFLAPKWRKIAERSPRQPWCSRQYDIRLSADFGALFKWNFKR